MFYSIYFSVSAVGIKLMTPHDYATSIDLGVDLPLVSRRKFLQTAGAVAVGLSANCSLGNEVGKVRLGVITDLHQDHIYDASRRLDQFLERAGRRELDALIQMGDFAKPVATNRKVIDTFNRGHRQCLHVIGNHDLDDGYTTDQVVAAWGMKHRYYTTDINGLRIIVLDGNDRPPGDESKYPASIGPEQLEWLTNQLKHPGPMLIFSHQPLAGSSAIVNAAEVQRLLSASADRILVAMNGHTHIDDVIRVEGVSYWHVNSSSYFHVGSKFHHESFSKELHEKHPTMLGMCPYQEPLFCFLEIDPVARTVAVTGKESTWVGPSPAQLGYPNVPPREIDKQIVPQIRSRQLKPV